jgi:hypothetical protein
LSAHNVPGIGLINPPYLCALYERKADSGERVMAKGHLINLLSGEIA